MQNGSGNWLDINAKKGMDTQPPSLCREDEQFVLSSPLLSSCFCIATRASTHRIGIYQVSVGRECTNSAFTGDSVFSESVGPAWTK